ncbi:MAG: aminopeptidase P family protein [Caldilineaceae bacterium]|nr:aminopeptidase P family protein [Caldilineaceae bacterium]
MKLSEEYQQRLARVQAQLGHGAADLLVVAPTHNMRYLLGFTPKYDERFCALLVGRDAVRLVVPHLNAGQVESHTGLQALRWTDESGPDHALIQALDELGVEQSTTLAVDDTMQARHLLLLQEMARPQRTVTGDALLASLRMRKSALEIEALARAAAQADRALLAGVDACRPGVSEREVAEAIVQSFRRDGAEQVDFTIVGSGPNGAFPHHHSGGRTLRVGDTIIIDIGATLDGYKSDITRVVHLGEPDPEVLEIYELVRTANERGRAAVRPGVTASAVDRATREPIDAAGYGDRFFHRTGHGLGIEEHEPPWISATSDTVLEPGMVFSIEPGIYLPGKFGVRVEDIVVVTEEGVRCLTGLGHELIVKQ